MSDCHGVHPEELSILSAAQQSPGATLKHCVQLRLLEQPLFVKQRDRVSARCTIISCNLKTHIGSVAVSHIIAYERIRTGSAKLELSGV